MDTNAFYRDIYQIVAQIPAGSVVTYGQLARLAGYPGYARLAGRALAHAPAGQRLPCHRVVDSRGRTTPGWDRQRELLEKEGVTFTAGGYVNLARHHWKEITDR